MQHIRSTCRLLPCTLCSRLLLPADRERHLEEVCPNRRRTCTRCGEAVILSEFARHEKEGGCPRRVVPCAACGAFCFADEVTGHGVRGWVRGEAGMCERGTPTASRRCVEFLGDIRVSGRHGTVPCSSGRPFTPHAPMSNACVVFAGGNGGLFIPSKESSKLSATLGMERMLRPWRLAFQAPA